MSKPPMSASEMPTESGQMLARIVSRFPDAYLDGADKAIPKGSLMVVANTNPEKVSGFVKMGTRAATKAAGVK